MRDPRLPVYHAAHALAVAAAAGMNLAQSPIVLRTHGYGGTAALQCPGGLGASRSHVQVVGFVAHRVPAWRRESPGQDGAAR